MKKVCIIGASGHYGYVLKGLRELEGYRLVGVAPGSSGERLDKVLEGAAALGASPQSFDNGADMLDQLQPDFVAVACHFGDHAKMAALALGRGIHAYVEKPVATTLDDLQMLRSAFAGSRAGLGAMFGIRCTPHFRTARQAVQDGAVGQIRLMQAQKSYRLGSRAEFFRRRASYGGTIPWVGSHAIDWVRWFSGEQFQSVMAMHSTAHNAGHGELEVTAQCQFAMTNDVFASVSIDYLRPQQAPTHADDRIRIAGTEGVLEVLDGRVLLVNAQEKGVRELPLLPELNPFADFVRRLEAEGESFRQESAEDAFAVTEACLRARQSADEGRLVRF